jgi:AcrR family transcriptional regulator
MALSHNTRPSAARRISARARTPRGNVSAIQRARMLTAAVEAVAELGYPRLTVTQVIARAGVSRKTFYESFRDRDDCFLAVFEEVVERARTLARQAFGAEAEWQDGVRAALADLLALCDEEPALARLCIVEALAAGEAALLRRAVLVGELAAVIDRGRDQQGAAQPPAVISQAVVGAVLSVLHARLLDREPQPLADLQPALMSMIVLPYLGPQASRSELGRRAPMRATKQPSRSRGGDGDPLAGLNMRLTYRTVRVLEAIAAQPGASNREIAAGSGVADQGQISKLLARLARLELVENRGAGQAKGAANAWHLTNRGARVQRVIWSR